MNTGEEPDILVVLGKQVTKNAKEIIETIQASLKEGVDQGQLEEQIRKYLAERVPQIKYFCDAIVHIDHPTQ